MENPNGNLTKNAIDLLNKRYFHLSEGEDSWCKLVDRVATAVAEAEPHNKDCWAANFFDLIYNLKFIPSTPCLMNADKDRPGQLSSCFVLAIKDNIESICEVDAQLAKIFQKNGGAGFNISALRPEKSRVEASNGYSSGPVGFMRKFDFTAEQMTENNTRKGAIKIDLCDWHPDIYKFIHAKDDTTLLKRMNISVSLSDKFMKAVIENRPWTLRFPDYSWNKEIYDKEWNGIIEDWEAKGYPVIEYQTVMARDLYREIMECAWKTGEPGVSFRDTMDRHNPNPHLGRVIGSNPCAEFVSISYNSCNLGSINLSNLVTNDELAHTSDYKQLIVDKLSEIVPIAFRFLDDMITVNRLPLKKIEEVTKSVRSVGLGCMGFADLLYQLGIKYNSEEGYALAETIFETIHNICLRVSQELAQEKGVYPAWEGSTWADKGIRVRNSNFLSIAPTGSISFIANTSGGIEPVYALVMTRTTYEGYKYFIVNPVFERELKKRGLYSDDILEKISQNNGSCQGIKEIPEDMQKVFVTTYDMTPAEHVKMLATIQRHVDLSCSKTVNLPNSATVEDIMNVYIDAWKQGIKGITVYRDGCRENQVLVAGKKEEDKQKVTLTQDGYVDVEPAMEVAYGKRIKVKTGCGHLWLFFFVDSKHNLAEIWSQVSGGGCKANIESMSRLVSLAFRAGIDPKHILDQLSSAFCKTSMDNVGSKSCGHVIAKHIKEFLDSNETIIPVDKNLIDIVEDMLYDIECNECNKVAVSLEDTTDIVEADQEDCDHVFDGQGCQTCVKCGYNKCEPQ